MRDDIIVCDRCGKLFYAEKHTELHPDVGIKTHEYTINAWHVKRDYCNPCANFVSEKVQEVIMEVTNSVTIL